MTKCPDCDGTGKIALLTSVKTCTRCDGSGFFYVLNIPDEELPVVAQTSSVEPFRPNGSLGTMWDYYKKHITLPAHEIAYDYVAKQANRKPNSLAIMESGMKYVGIAPESEWVRDPEKMKVKDIAEAGMYWIVMGGSENGGWSAIEVYEHPERGGLHVHCMRHPGVFTLDCFKSEFNDRDCRPISLPTA